ncbi:hypothetical protein Avbf_09102, partial [Armadillidium vulgare]
MNPIDLNLEPSILAQPFHCEIEHKLGLTCLTQGLVVCKVRLDRGGYVPGETISIWARVQNHSRVTIKKTKACLTETIQYMSRSKVVQTETRELSAVSRGLYNRTIKFGKGNKTPITHHDGNENTKKYFINFPVDLDFSVCFL